MSGTSGSIPTISGFTAGDIVISEVGGANAAQTGVNADNAASPITLIEIDPTTDAIVGEEVLPQTASGNNDPISGEYGSSSEGTLQLAGNGQSLVIAGYGVNATTYNEGGAATYGNAALAQSTSLTNQTTYTPVARVVADISYNGSVDTSTALFNIYNVNNPRSVATINGSVFYLGGQGNKDATQGVFEAADGASSATAINTANDVRDVEIYNGQLYVSEDTKVGPNDGIATFAGLPTSATTPTFLTGIETSVVLTAATANGIDDSQIGKSVDLSPENYFFANPTTLYVADGGDPKEGTLGDGGLQKWTLNTTTGVWSLDYTLNAGLPLSPNTLSDGTSGLIGLTGTLNANGTVTLFATTEGIGDLDNTYLVTVTDTVANRITPAGESFTILQTANSGFASTAVISGAETSGTVNIRGIAEAPSAPTSTTISGGQTTAAGTTVSNGSVLTVLAGGTASAVVVNSAGLLYISSGGVETGSLIATGGSAVIAGSATGDTVFGTQFVSATGAASGEVVSYGGVIAAYAGASISNTTVATGGELLVSAAAAMNAVIAGGEIVVEGSGGQIAGGVTFSGGGELIMAGNNGLGGLTAVIADFAGADAIDLAFIGAGATLTSSTAGGNTDLAVTSGGVTESFVLSGNYEPGSLVLKADATSGVEIAVQSSVLSGTMTVSSGNVSPDKVIGATLTGTINSGGTAISTTIQSGGVGVVSGLDLAATVQAGGSEIIYSSASGDVIYGTQNVSSAAATGNGSVTNEVVGSGGQIDLFIKGGAATSTFVESAGAIFISGNAQASNTVLSGGSIVLESGKSELTGGVIFDGAGAIVYSTFVSASGSSGDLAVLSGFGVDDVISFTSAAVGLSGTLTITSGANTTATISGTGGSETLIFAGSGVPLVYNANVSGGGTLTEGTISSGGSTGSSGTGSSGTGSSGTGSTVSTNIVSGGQVVTIGAGGTELSGTILSGGSIVVSASGFDSGTKIEAGGSELVFGTAYGDAVSGAQMISGNAYYETVYSGGAAELLYKGAIGSGLTVLGGGSIYINGRGSATNIVLDGGAIVLNSPKATTFGTLDFATSGTIVVETATSALTVGSSWGPEAVISNFGGGDVVDITAFGYAGAIFTSGTSGGNTIVTVSSGTGTQSEEILTFAGTNPGAIQLVSGASGEAELVVSVTSVTSAVTVSSGTSLVNFTVASGGSVTVASGATVSNGSVTSGAVIVSGGTDIHLQVGAGGSETLTGSGAADIGGIVTSGGSVLLTSGATTSNITLAGGNLLAGPGTTQDPTTISSGSTDTFSGAAGTGTVILSGGAEVLISGGVESGGSDSGLLVLSNGGTAIGETVSAGGLISGVVGGTLISGVILAGGSVVMSSYDSGTVISAGGSELLMGSGSGDIVGGSQLVSGPLDVVNSETVLSGGVVNISTTSAVTSGDVIMSGGTIIDNGRNYVDNLTISGGTLVLDSAKATTSGTITFAGSGGLIDVAVTPSLTSSSFSLNAATVIGFTAGDVVEAGFVSYAGATLTSSGSGGNTVVTISGTGGAESFVLSGTHAAGFALIDEGGFAAATANPCYCTGTRILGIDGDIAVEDIKVGDELVTVRDGGPLSAKVIWTGKRDLDLLRRPDADTLYPVRITAGAIAPGLPERDLRVSPNHAIYLDGLLFEAQALVNGTTIFRETTTRFVTYHHIELAAHDIILAEGVPAESYLDTGNRNAFDTEDCTALFPDFGKPQTAKTCVPLIIEGAALEEVQAKLVRRAKAA